MAKRDSASPDDGYEGHDEESHGEPDGDLEKCLLHPTPSAVQRGSTSKGGTQARFLRLKQDHADESASHNELDDVQVRAQRTSFPLVASIADNDYSMA